MSARATAAAAPPLLDPHDVYAADRPNRLTGAALRALPRVYVPNSQAATVDVRRSNGKGGTFNYFDLYRTRLPEMNTALLTPFDPCFPK